MEWILNIIFGSSTVYYGYGYYSLKSYKKESSSVKGGNAELVLSSLHHPDENVALQNALIILGSAVASVDGIVTSPEVNVITSHLQLDTNAMKDESILFEAAKGLDLESTTYANIIAARFRSPKLRNQIIDFLTDIAKADGNYDELEKKMIDEIRIAFES